MKLSLVSGADSGPQGLQGVQSLVMPLKTFSHTEPQVGLDKGPFVFGQGAIRYRPARFHFRRRFHVDGGEGGR